MTAADALRVAATFGVDVRDARANRLSGGYSNESWRVRGPAAAAVVRKYGRLHVSRAALVFEHAVAEHLAARIPEVAAPLRDAADQTLVLDDGAYVAVLPWIDGTTGARDPLTAAGAARALARFHVAGRDMHVAGGMRSTRFLGILPWLIARFQRFGAAESPVARALPWDDLIVALAASTARVVARATQLPHAILHGDPNPGNVVVRDGSVRALIDFDFVHESERVYDVGAFVDEFARADDDAALSLERIGALIAAYHAEAPLSAHERELLPDAMLRHAATLVWYVVTRHGERTPGDVGGAPRYAARVSEIARYAEAIRRAA
jgi:Ser/Thr protein kinase RdoA (MazF antagonist)